MKNESSWVLGSKRSLAMMVCAASLTAAVAQPPSSSFNFNQSSGSYNPLNGGTVVASGPTLDDQISAAITIPTFNFNGVGYTQLFISANGFITLGVAPTGTNYTPLSNAAPYVAAISAFGTDLTSRAGEGVSDVRYAQVSNEFVVEWRNVRRKGLAEWFSFQIRLNTTNGVIKMVYGPIGSGPAMQTSLQPQVGVRGLPTPSDVQNRRVGTGVQNWNNSLPGNAITNTMRFTSTPPAKFFMEGLTYNFIPPGSACTAMQGGPSLIGTPCNDGNPQTSNDTWGADCVCAGEIVCTEDLIIEFQTDANGSQTSWEILNQDNLVSMCDGFGYPNSAVVTSSCCLPQGCYILRVYDSAGDGMASGNNGGYILRNSPNNERIIDNRNNFLSGSVSAISEDQGFCLPIGSDRVIFSSCDKLNWVNDQFIVASLNPEVSALWIDGAPNSQQSTTTGYQFWFFDPNGSYSFRWFRNHATSHGFGTGAARAAHLRINNWLPAYHIPENVLMNVRVRSFVNGVASEWGPACRFKIDPVAAACPPTKLIDNPAHQFQSCGQFRTFSFNSYVHAFPVSGATQYQFRFRQPAEGYEVVRTTTSYFAQLWWAAPLQPLVNGSQYEVDVRAFKDGDWCAWGDICTLNIGTPAAQPGATQNFASEPAGTVALNMWPNPNQGDQLFLSMSEVPAGAQLIMVDMFDLYGKRVFTRSISTNDGMISTVIDLNGELAAGMYMVNITAGEAVHSQRLVIQR